MLRKTALTLAIPLTLAATLCGSRTAEAADRFGVVGIENKTRVPIRLQHRWGDGEWRVDLLGPGTRKWYWWEYQAANENRSPPFHVKFDSDLSPGQFFEKYDLKKRAAPAHDWDFAHKYVFKYNGNTSFVDLYDQR